ncbi:MAG: hypothetical protein L3J97_06805, partial [Thermoplasmata archaeon]|nr:hypothetical protein [Thermoplasmata archaeon]
KTTDVEWAARRQTSAILDAFRGDVASTGGTLILAYLPVGHEIDAPDAPGSGGAFFSEYCAGRAADCVDLRPAFSAEARAGLALKTVGHWDRREHHIAARVLADHLRDTGQTASRARRAALP